MGAPQSGRMWVIGHKKGDKIIVPWRQTDIFDPALAKEAKERGMALATDHLLEWKEQARRWILEREWGETFTADDLVEAIGKPTDTEGRPTNAGIGGVINGLAKQERIIHNGWTKSSRVSNHSSDLRVWERRLK